MNEKKDALDMMRKIESHKLPIKIRLFYFCIGFGLSNILFYHYVEIFAKIKMIKFRDDLEDIKKMIKYEEKKN